MEPQAQPRTRHIPKCRHLADVGDPAPGTKGCEECLATGERWRQLRRCLTCGHIGCCDSSPGQHAQAHFHSTQHPIIQSHEPGETWKWCYVDEDYVA